MPESSSALTDLASDNPSIEIRCSGRYSAYVSRQSALRNISPGIRQCVLHWLLVETALHTPRGAVYLAD